MKKIVIPILIIILFICGGVVLFQNCNDFDLSFLNISGCNKQEEQEKPPIVTDVFKGEINFYLENENNVVYPTLEGSLTTSKLPDDYYITFNNDVKPLPEGGFKYTKYANYYDVTFNSVVLYDSIDAGVYTASFYAYYKNTDTMRLIDTLPVAVGENLYYGDYLLCEGEPVVGMYEETMQNTQNFVSTFELVETNYIMPEFNLWTYAYKVPTAIEATIDEQTITIPTSEFEIIEHDTYYEINVSTKLFFDRIKKGTSDLIIKVYSDDVVIRSTTIRINTEYALYSETYINSETGERIEVMDSDAFWIGPY